MARRTDFQKAITYTGQKIKGPVDITFKIDGVRILYRDGKFVTRNDKVPPGLETALTTEAKDKIRYWGDCEVFTGSFFKSNGPLQQHEPEVGCIDEQHIFTLDHGKLDPRLQIRTVTDPTEALILSIRDNAVEAGYEGLVLRTPDRWYRVKPSATADVRVTGWFEQKDKKKNPKGQLGGFNTAYGKVTAFTEEMRKELCDNPEQYVGRLIEVQYKELYDTGSFRYAVKFLRFRDDKDTESFDTK